MKSIEDSWSSALRYAIRLLSYRDRSVKELVEKLTSKGISLDIAAKVTDYLKEKGFVDDGRLAESLRRDALERKCLGKRGVKEHLLKRGIPTEIVDGVVGEEEDYLTAAKKLVEKKMKSMRDLDDEFTKKRLWGILLRRGFSADIIRRAIKTIEGKE